MSVRWYSENPRDQQLVDYSPADSKLLEDSYQGPKQPVDLTFFGQRVTVDVNTMLQTNQSGGTRKVIRTVTATTPAAPTKATTDIITVSADSKFEVSTNGWKWAPNADSKVSMTTGDDGVEGSMTVPGIDVGTKDNHLTFGGGSMKVNGSMHVTECQATLLGGAFTLPGGDTDEFELDVNVEPSTHFPGLMCVTVHGENTYTRKATMDGIAPPPNFTKGGVAGGVTFAITGIELETEEKTLYEKEDPTFDSAGTYAPGWEFIGWATSMKMTAQMKGSWTKADDDDDDNDNDDKADNDDEDDDKDAKGDDKGGDKGDDKPKGTLDVEAPLKAVFEMRPLFVPPRVLPPNPSDPDTPLYRWRKAVRARVPIKTILDSLNHTLEQIDESIKLEHMIEKVERLQEVVTELEVAFGIATAAAAAFIGFNYAADTAAASAGMKLGLEVTELETAKGAQAAAEEIVDPEFKPTVPFVKDYTPKIMSKTLSTEATATLGKAFTGSSLLDTAALQAEAQNMYTESVAEFGMDKIADDDLDGMRKTVTEMRDSYQAKLEAADNEVSAAEKEYRDDAQTKGRHQAFRTFLLSWAPQQEGKEPLELRFMHWPNHTLTDKSENNRFTFDDGDMLDPEYLKTKLAVMEKMTNDSESNGFVLIKNNCYFQTESVAQLFDKVVPEEGCYTYIREKQIPRDVYEHHLQVLEDGLGFPADPAQIEAP